MHNGVAIALAWPDTYCKQAGAWYDGLMNLLRISKNNYYKVGHSAIILIDKKTETCKYFDFGRYHSPFGFGRVRDEITDHELIMKSVPCFDSNGALGNLEEILEELYYKKACHGDGDIHASTCKIQFELAFSKAKEMQAQGVIEYGPFVRKGTNCSRFVRTIVASGKPSIKTFISISTPILLSPSPMHNVKSLANQCSYGQLEGVESERQLAI